MLRPNATGGCTTLKPTTAFGTPRFRPGAVRFHVNVATPLFRSDLSDRGVRRMCHE